MNVGLTGGRRESDAAEKLFKFLIVVDGHGDVGGADTHGFVVTSGISRELKNLSDEVLNDRGKIDDGPGADATLACMSRVVLHDILADTRRCKLKTSAGRSGDGLGSVLLRTMTCIFNGGCKLGDCLGALGNGMFGKLSGKTRTDGRLNITSRQHGATADATELVGTFDQSLDEVMAQRVGLGHSSRADASVRMNLLQDLVDVGLVAIKRLLLGRTLLGRTLLGRTLAFRCGHCVFDDDYYV